MRRALATLGVVLCALGATTACGGEASSPDSGGSTAAPQVIDVTFDGDDVTPNGERVEISVGQPVELHVTADRAGEIHVHSDPEQELEYEEGTATVTIRPIERPGTVDVESHALDRTIVQLEVH